MRRLFGLVFLVSFAECGSGSNEKICLPGVTQVCVCPGGSQGAQACDKDGMAWGQCQCSTKPDARVDVRPPDASNPDATRPDVTRPDAGPPDIAADMAWPDVSKPDLQPCASTSTSCGPPGNCVSCVNNPAGSACVNQACSCSSNTDCDDGLTCTTDICGVGGCTHVVNGNFCLIGNACVVSGTANPTTTCQKCDPIANDKGWTNDDGKLCDDKNDCSYGDKCTGGTCKGTAYSCDDAVTCTTDTCLGTGPAPTGCGNIPKAGYCAIDGICYSDGQASTASACLICTVSADQLHWSPNLIATCKVENFVPPPGAVAGWVENPDEGKPGVEAGYSTAEIQAIIDGAHDPYAAAGCNGFSKQDYKKGSGTCSAGVCTPGTYGTTLFLWDMKDYAAAKAMFDKNQSDGVANGLTFEVVPSAPATAIIANDTPQWKAHGHKDHYVYKLYTTYAAGESVAAKTEVVTFIQYVANHLP